MKVNLKNTVMGLFMLGVPIAAVHIYNSQKGANKIIQENLEKIDNALKVESYSNKSLFDARQMIDEIKESHEQGLEEDRKFKRDIANLKNNLQ